MHKHCISCQKMQCDHVHLESKRIFFSLFFFYFPVTVTYHRELLIPGLVPCNPELYLIRGQNKFPVAFTVVSYHFSTRNPYHSETSTENHHEQTRNSETRPGTIYFPFSTANHNSRSKKTLLGDHEYLIPGVLSVNSRCIPGWIYFQQFPTGNHRELNIPGQIWRAVLVYSILFKHLWFLTFC